MRQNILNVAINKLGVKEDPPGSNRQEFGAWFGFNDAEWCGIFCSYCYSFGGHPLGILDFYKGFASVPFAYNHYKNLPNNDGSLRITKNPLTSDLVLFDWNKDGSPDHVGLFEKWIDKDKGAFSTIEGNTSINNQSNGGEVMRRERSMYYVHSFINPLNLPPDA